MALAPCHPYAASSREIPAGSQLSEHPQEVLVQLAIVDHKPVTELWGVEEGKEKTKMSQLMEMEVTSAFMAVC